MGLDIHGIGMTSQRTRTRLIAQLRDMGILSETILSVIMNTPRHVFVDEALASRAYENTALPIGYNQTISQPYIVAKMVEALYGQDDLSNILEIGTGCGYQTAILAQLSKKIYSVERIAALAKSAKQKLRALKYNNIDIKCSDGTFGWLDHAPFDGIIVAAAPMHVPKDLLKQLAMNGRLVIPTGSERQQKLSVFTRIEDGFKEDQLDMVSFVPMLTGIVP